MILITKMHIRFRLKTSSTTFMSLDLTFSSLFRKFLSAMGKKNSMTNQSTSKYIILHNLMSKMGNQWNLLPFQLTNSLVLLKAGKG